MNLPKNANLWLPAYIRDRAARLAPGQPKPKRLWVAITDHFEPLGGNPPPELAVSRMAAWQNLWPSIAANAPRDAANRPPCFTFFYPQEEYDPAVLDQLAELTRTGTTDVEIHLHHDHDHAGAFQHKMATFRDILHQRHGLLRHHNGRLVFGFIHGNWALDNSRPDGRWCGVTGELQLLRDLGCYADFTMPSLPSPTQSRILNQIYWTNGDPAKPRGFDHGTPAKPGRGVHGDLLMITGPTGLRYRGRLFPRIETGELAHYDPPTPDRVQRWIALAPRIGEDIFIKLYGHSAREDNAAALLGNTSNPGTLASMFQWIHEAAHQHNLQLHWASAFQMYQQIESLITPGGAS